MAGSRIEREVVIAAPIEVVWRTVTEPDLISQWFADRVTLDLKPGGRGELVFGASACDAAHSEAIVVETVERPTRFSFRWAHPQGEAPVADNSMLVEFTLQPEGDEHTRLRVAESDLDVVAWPTQDKARYEQEHRQGWERCFSRLVRLPIERHEHLEA